MLDISRCRVHVLFSKKKLQFEIFMLNNTSNPTTDLSFYVTTICGEKANTFCVLVLLTRTPEKRNAEKEKNPTKT